MISFFSPEAATLLAFFLIGYVAWLVLKSLAKGMHGEPDTLRRLTLSVTKSESGKCYAENAFYHGTTGKYVADVVCPELDYRWMVIADSQQELEEKVRKEFDRCEEGIRDKINKEVMSRPLYFRIK